MPIPEAQLEIWSHQGSVTQSSKTYNAIKAILENADAPYSDKNYKVFLQGSYGNDTNVYAESDVDIVIRLDDCFQSDLNRLPQESRDAYDKAFANAVYTHAEFKDDVLAVLGEAYGKDVTPGNKAIALAANGARRKVDVIVAVQFRRYYKFNGLADQSFDAGICFWDKAGTQIANYPKQHAENCVSKHQATNNWFKPMVRVLKNMRTRLVDDGLLDQGIAPSYYLEGLLYNVPNDKFGGTYEDSFVNAINWVLKADRSKFVCANEQYYLLHESSPVTWRAGQCDQFLDSVVKLWNDW